MSKWRYDKIFFFNEYIPRKTNYEQQKMSNYSLYRIVNYIYKYQL